MQLILRYGRATGRTSKFGLRPVLQVFDEKDSSACVRNPKAMHFVPVCVFEIQLGWYDRI